MLKENTYQKISLQSFTPRSSCNVLCQDNENPGVNSKQWPRKHVMSMLCFLVLSCGVWPTMYFSSAHVVCVTRSPEQWGSWLCGGRKIHDEMIIVSSSSITSRDIWSTNRWCNSVYFQQYIYKVSHTMPRDDIQTTNTLSLKTILWMKSI